MKTKPEFRAQALRFAKKNGFETTHFRGIYEGFEVYTVGYKVPCVIGLPQVILVNDETIKFDTFRDPFKILHACKQLPKVVFEYDCMCWFGNSYNLKLLDDGRLVRLAYGYSKLGPEDRMCDDKEYVLLNSPELVKGIKKLIKENKEELKKIPREISNYNILDGACETFRFGRMKFYGSNALTESMEGYQEKLKNIMRYLRVGKKNFYSFRDFLKCSKTSSMSISNIHFSMGKIEKNRRNKIMMMAPEQYAEQFENASYQEILKVKNELISDISKFEHDYDREDPDWNICPKPDVRYQWNLEALGLIASLLAEAFNREYGGDMRKVYGEV